MAVSGWREQYRLVHCDAHEKYERSCRTCDRLRYEAMVAEHMPQEIIGPWKARAATEAPGWEASMSPLLADDAPVMWFLRRSGVGLSDWDQDELIAKAKRWDSVAA